MIRNRAEAMSCGGCHQNSNNTEIAPNVNWPKSRFFVHVDEQGTLSSALTEQFFSPLALMSVLNSLSCHGLLINELERT
jgi:hypothetical protein